MDEEYLNEIIMGNMMSGKKSENEESTYYVDSMLACSTTGDVDRYTRQMRKMGVKNLYEVMKMMNNGFQTYLAPLESSFKKRKRTLIFNLVMESIKEIQGFLYQHIKFGDIAGLVIWVTDTYGIDRHADRLRKHFTCFKALATDKDLKNFDNWLAKAIGYLANDRILQLATPAIFVRLQLQEGMENYGSTELKRAWHESENELIRSRKEKHIINDNFLQKELEEFLGEVKTRYHTYSSQLSNQINNNHQNRYQQQPRNQRRVMMTQTQTNGKKVCAFHNMIYGCNKTECNFDHVVLEDDEKRAKLIDIASKNSRCNVCGISGHQGSDCTKKNEMKKILKERKSQSKKAKRVKEKDDEPIQKEGEQKEEEETENEE